MQIKSSSFGYATCEGMGLTREIETLLVGEQPVGTWLLVFLNSAREVLSEQDAIKITNAVQAVDLIMQNDGTLSESGLNENTIEALFSDLIDREPQKPASLIALEKSQLLNNGD